MAAARSSRRSRSWQHPLSLSSALDAKALATYLGKQDENALTSKEAARARETLFREHVGRFRTKVANFVYRGIARQIPDPK
jgi:hypothetical protein